MINSDEVVDIETIYAKLAEERILFLSEEIDASVATTLSAHLLWLDSQNKNEITLYINSCGGTVNDGLLTIYDTMQHITAPIKTICIGEAFSAAAIILSSGAVGSRCALPHAKIMIHAIQVSDLGGSQDELEKEAKRLKKVNTSLMEIIARHTGQSLTKIKRDCKHDKYMTAAEALEYGLIDVIITPKKKIPKLKK